MKIAAANFAGLLLTRVVEREGEFSLRRALGDPSRESEAKRGLVQRLFSGKIGYDAMAVVTALSLAFLFLNRRFLKVRA